MDQHLGLGPGAPLGFPSPPLYGLASRANGSTGTLSSLDDVFADVFFSPEGDLLDMNSDDEEPGLAFSSLPSLLGLNDLAQTPPLEQRGMQFAVRLPGSMPPSAPWAPTGSPSALLPHAEVHEHTRAVREAQVAQAVKEEMLGLREPTPHPPPKRQRQRLLTEAMTEEQKTERRERNREHAKRSRVRKKFLLDSLQRSVMALQEENESLKDAIREYLGPRADTLIAQHAPPVASLVTANPRDATKILDDPDYSLVKALQTAHQNFVITDNGSPDNPIVFASAGFLTLTGYARDQVLGRNCRFLQGPETDPRAVDKIRRSIDRGEDTSVCLLNYRVDGSTFWNQFFVAALRDANGNIVNFVGVQCKVSEDYAKIVVEEQNKVLDAAAQGNT